MTTKLALLLATIVLASTPLQALAATVAITPPAAALFTFSDILARIASGTPATDDVGKIKATTSVSFVELHDLQGYDPNGLVFTPDQLKAVKLVDLAIGRNTALNKKIWHAGYLLTDVVAVALDPTGKAVVFINL